MPERIKRIAAAIALKEKQLVINEPEYFRTWDYEEDIFGLGDKVLTGKELPLKTVTLEKKPSGEAKNFIYLHKD